MSKSLWVLAIALTLPAWADLDKAQRLIDQRSYAQACQEAARCRQEDPGRAELLQIWGMGKDLQESAAQRRLAAFHPNAKNSLLYLIVRSELLDTAAKDLKQALPLCTSPSQRVDVLLRLFYNTRYPADQPYWQEAAELAAQHPLPHSLLVRLSLAHINLLCSQKRAAEAWNDLAQTRSMETPVWLAKAEILNNLNRPQEAQEARWKAIEVCPDPLWQMQLLKRISDNRTDLTVVVGKRLLAQLDRIQKQARQWPENYALYAFRLRSIVCQETGLGLADWLKQADTLGNQRLALSERALVRLRHYQTAEAGADLRHALQLPAPDDRDSLFATARTPVLEISLAALALGANQFQEAERCARHAQQAASSPSDFFIRQSADQTLLRLLLKTGRVDEARTLVADIFRQAEQAEMPAVRVTTYTNVLNSLLIADLHPSRLFTLSPEAAPFRMDPDTPSGWLFQEIRQDPELLARIFMALDAWKQRAGSPSSRGQEAALRGLVLACLDRPLEAIDCYTRGIEESAGAPAIQGNLGLLLSHELLGQNRRDEALSSMRLSYQHVSQAGSLALPGRYRLGLVGHLIEHGLRQEAISLIDQGLKEEEGGEKTMLLFLRARANRDAQQLKATLEQNKDPRLAVEMLLQLAQWEPQGRWLEQIATRDLKPGLKLAQAYRQQGHNERALEVCQQTLQQFQDYFEQLPVSARLPASQSPTLLSLLDMTVELSIDQQRPQQGARWLGVWRAMQQRPGQVSPELEHLRAELTGLRHSGDPQVEAQLASTRAQFLQTLTDLRQRNPDMETALSAQGNELLALQPYLDEQTLLVQYYLAPEGLYIQSVSKQGQTLQSVRVEKARLLQLLQRWSEAMQSPAGLRPEDLEASRQLYSLLVSPLRQGRQGHPNLWIMPSGDLWSLPFETLQDEKGRYLIESSSCAYLGPSEAILLVQPGQVAQGDWVGLGNTRLAGTLSELQQIRALFPSGQILSGPEASWTRLQSIAPLARFLHIATHSQDRPDRPGESYLELADGKLPLSQIYRLSLPAGSLVVLSSCSGAVAQQHRERDLLSLSSGFRAAGASAVVASLWPVDDQATASFFAPMYREILAGNSRQQGLQKAKQEMLHSANHAHPFYWGAFTLLGDPR